MEDLLQILKSDNFLLVMFCLNVILLISSIFNIICYSKLNKRYKNFMKKIGDGKDIEEDLENYMYKVGKVEEKNAELANDINGIKTDLTTCIKKVGVVRYSAYENIGSDLSFTLALLDEQNNGTVLNGIYSREMSNIYAKPVEKGKSSYTLSKEEEMAIQKAISNKKNAL